MESQSTVVQNIGKEELMVYQELFSFFDKEDNGEIPIRDVSLYMRGLGHCPTQEQLKQIQSKLYQHSNKNVTFSKLISFLQSRKREQNIEDELIEAFEGYQLQAGAHSDSSKNSYVSIIGLKKFLCEFGQTFSQSQAEAFIEFLKANDLKVNDQEFDFKSLTKIMAYSYTEI